MTADTSRANPWLDRLGASASIVCAVHCAAMTLVVAMWPALWLRQRIGGIELRWLLWLEWGLATASLALAVTAAWHGWRQHRRLHPVLLLCAGALLLVVGVFTRLHFVPGWGTALVVAGGAVLVAGHWANLRLGARCAHP